MPIRTAKAVPGIAVAAVLLAGCVGGPTASAKGSPTTPMASPTTPVMMSSASAVPTAPTALLAMGDARAAERAVLLGHGRVVVIGGFKSDVPVPSGEVYDPDTNAFRLFDSPAPIQYFHTATLLDDGRVIVIGGFGSNNSPIDVVRTWDPNTLTFADAGSTPEPRILHTATLLADGRVLIVGGVDPKDGGAVRSSAIVWSPTNGKAAAAGELLHGRAWHSATRLPDGRVLVTGGPAEAEIWDPATERFTPAGKLANARWWGSAALLSDGRVLVTGGFVGEQYTPEKVARVAEAEVWDPATSSFTLAGKLSVARAMHTSEVLADGRVVVIGGSGGSDPGTAGSLASVEIWDPATNSFSAGPKLLVARGLHASVLMPDGRILVIGGSDEAGNTLATAEWLSVAAR